MALSLNQDGSDELMRQNQKLHQDYMEGNINLEKFLEEYRKPGKYRPEDISANRGHKYEAP